MGTLAARRMQICHSLQLALVILTFCLDFGHGIALGEYDVAFHPMYRLRQSLAIAISRMRSPPAHGYLAYQSVIDSLNQKGFAVFNSDKGPHLEGDDSSALFKDTKRLDRALRDARGVVIDPRLPPQIIRGNEIGYADYMYMAFRLFGLHIASLYYFYFIVLGIACALFVLEYRRSPFLMFLLTSYLAGLFFLENYAESQGDQLGSLANSRLFDALSLLPAMHIFIAIWRKLPAKRPTVATASAQAVILVFLVSTRTAALWQLGMIVVVGTILTLAGAWKWRHSISQSKERILAGGWFATLTIFLLGLHVTYISLVSDARYKQETEGHLFWHSILGTLLEDSSRLQLIYVGNNKVIAEDQIAYDAVIKDLNDRHDSSSPVAFVYRDGQTPRISIDLQRSNAAYDALARSLVLTILARHPTLVIKAIPNVISWQLRWFGLRHSMGWKNLFVAGAIGLVGGLLWIGAAASRVERPDVINGAIATSIVLACASVPLLLAPSNLSVGTLLSFLIAILMGLVVLFGSIVIVAERTLTARQQANWTDNQGTNI
jgi:hypothetical protein